DCQCAPRQRSSPHFTDFCYAEEHLQAPGYTGGENRRGKEVASAGPTGHLRSGEEEEAAGRADGAQRTMASKENSAVGFVNVSREITECIRKVLDKQPIKFVRAIKQETRGGKSEDRVLVRVAIIFHLQGSPNPT
ncbi:hypothetical protein GOODEAATRI_023163, partial [Goodea atripinnis]